MLRLKLTDLLHTTHLGYSILSARRLSHLDITAEIRAELDVNMKSIELGNRETLQAFEEAFGEGQTRRHAPFAADNLPADWKAAIKVRQDYLSGVLHFPHAIRFLGAVEFLQSTARTFE